MSEYRGIDQEEWELVRNQLKDLKHMITKVNEGQYDQSRVENIKQAHDPWEHREIGMRCQTCMWFVEKNTEMPRVDVLGRCRRHAPTMSGYPVVFGSDWCGDHKLKQ